MNSASSGTAPQEHLSQIAVSKLPPPDQPLNHPRQAASLEPVIAAPRAPAIAVVDDDAQMRNALETLLRENGFCPHLFSGGDELAAGREPFDLYLIDLRLAGENGLDIAQHVARTTGTPIIMMTGAGDEIDKIVCLEAAADDYIFKPFNPRELIARIRALLRRCRRNPALTQWDMADSPAEGFRFGPYLLDYANRLLLDSESMPVSLTNAEFRLLEYLTLNANRVINRVELLGHLGSDFSHYVDRTIDVLILRLRRKIEPQPTKPIYLQTKRGRGYVLVIGDSPGIRQ